MAKKPKIPSLPELTKKLTGRFARWDHLYKHGGSDPFWSDDVGLNLVRNHIIYTKRQLLELFPEELPEVYHRSTPGKIEQEYFARKDEIEANAKKSLENITNDPNYCFIMNAYGHLSDEERMTINVRWVVQKVESLHKALEKKDYLTMRCNRNVRYVLEKCEEYAVEIDALLNQTNRQATSDAA